MGMTGFDIVTYSHCLLLAGIAMVPVTHLLHIISAKPIGKIFAALEDTVVNAFRSMQPQYALVA